MPAKPRKKAATRTPKRRPGKVRPGGAATRKAPRPPALSPVANAKGATAAPPNNSGERLLDMTQAIKLLKTTRATFYRWLRSGKIRGMKVGRQWRFERSEIERFLKGEEPRIELRTDITPLLEDLRERTRKLKAKEISLPAQAGPQRAVKLIVELGIAMDASDIHLAAHTGVHGREKLAVLRYRVDGVLHPAADIDIRLLPAIIEQWKTFAGCNPRETTPQDGRIIFEIAGEKEGCHLFVSFLPTHLGDSVTARILRRDVSKLTQPVLDTLGFAPRDKEKISKWTKAPWGLIVLNGPTGCGKTITMYACLNHLNTPQIKVMTVEDPVELAFPWMVQVQVNEKTGLTFARVVRSFLRSDPDVIMVGEIRDREVLGLCFQTTLTGHLVLTSLNADESAKALTRMIDIEPAPFMVADTVKLGGGGATFLGDFDTSTIMNNALMLQAKLVE